MFRGYVSRRVCVEMNGNDIFSWVFVFGFDKHDFLSKLLVVMNKFDGLFRIDFAKGQHEHLIQTW